MGVVWRAHHVELVDREVAIKLIAPDWASQETSRRLFEQEMRAVARLSHPGLVSVYDYGIAPGGHPFLAMEYVCGGSLDGQWPWFDWGTTASVLLDVCHALGHAHARGIIHKDLKPANILLGGGEVPRAKLTDFGVAHALSDVASKGASGEDLRGLGDGGAGTPSYMPPEQIVGRWRDFGPWTDLYALGCVAWEMVCGRSPFYDPAMMKVLSGHMYQPLPAFEPRFDVPKGVETWLRQLLCKRESDRFLMAHDAACVLEDLGASEALGWSQLRARARQDQEGEAGLTQTLKDSTREGGAHFTQFAWGGHGGMTAAAAGPEPTHQGVRVRGGEQGVGEGESAPNVARPWPATWERREQAVEVLQNTGLGVFGVRDVPLVGRQGERQRLWDGLGRVCQGGGPWAMVLSGPSGVGKSALAEWLVTRAQELGLVYAVRVPHDPVANRVETIARLMEYHACCYGLDRGQIERRLRERFGQQMGERRETVQVAALASSLAQLMTPQGDAAAQNMGEREQGVVWEKALEMMVGEKRRPVVIWLEDVQWSGVTLGVVKRLVGRLKLPVLFLMTLRDDLIVEMPHQLELIRQMIAQGGAEAVELEAMSAEDQRRLLDQLLSLSTAWRSRILERTQGNPLFCIQLVSDWIDRGLLLPGKEGFEVREAAGLELPADLHALWRLRLDRALEEVGSKERAWEMLGVCAALGLEVDERELWVAYEGGEFGRQEWAQVSEALVGQRLIRRTQKGWSFVHGMLRESILGHVEVRGLSESIHGLCAQALRAVWGEHMVGQAERVARHWIQAKAPEQALLPLLEATYHYQISGQYERAEQVLEVYEQVVRDLGLGDADVYALRARMQRVWLEWSRQGISEALHDEVRAIAQVAKQGGLHSLLGECWRWRGLVSRFEDEVEESVRQFSVAKSHYRRVDDVEGQSRCNLSLAVSLREQGKLEEAEGLLIEAIEFATAREFYILLPRCFGNLAEVSMQRGRWTQAQQRYERAEAVALQMGDRRALAFALGGLAELAVLAEDRARAKRLWRSQEALFGAMGSSYKAHAQVGLAALELLSGQLEHAHRWFLALDRAPHVHTHGTKLRVLTGLVEVLYRCETTGAQSVDPELLCGVEALIRQEHQRRGSVHHALIPEVTRALHNHDLSETMIQILQRIEATWRGV